MSISIRMFGVIHLFRLSPTGGIEAESHCVTSRAVLLVKPQLLAGGDSTAAMVDP